MAFQTMKSFDLISIKRRFPIWTRIVSLFETQTALNFRREFFAFVDAKVAKRLSMETVRPDFMTFIMRHQDEKGMTLKEIESTLNSFMIAGSEISATSLSGTTLLLIKNSDKMERLVEEIRNTFKSSNQITMEGVSKLPYLSAVISESLRLYPSVPTGFSRVVPEGEDVISGHWVPEKVSLSQGFHIWGRLLHGY